MKLTFQLLSLLLSLTLLIFSCGKDDETEDPNNTDCGSLVCLNGGTCNSGACNCPENFEGPTCETPVAPKSLQLTNVAIKNFPVNDEFGNGWDPSDQADITFRIKKGTDIKYTHSEVVSNADPNVDHFFSVPSFSFENIGESYIFELLDDDGAGIFVLISENTFKAELASGTGGVISFSGASQIELTVKYVY